jgi:hypothetical protein
VRQVVSQLSAVGSLGWLADLTTEALFAPSRGEEGGEGLALGGTPLAASDGGDLAAPDLFSAALAVTLLGATRLDRTGPSADRERRWRC